MCRQEQGIRQLIDGSCHVAEDEAGAEPVGGAVGQDDFPQFQAGQLQRLTPKAMQAIALVEARRKQLRSRPGELLMKLRTRSASCQMSSYCCWVIGMTICLAPRGTCVEGVFRSRSTCRVFGRAFILASPSLERSRMTKMAPAGYPAFLQYLQSGSQQLRTQSSPCGSYSIQTDQSNGHSNSRTGISALFTLTERLSEPSLSTWETVKNKGFLRKTVAENYGRWRQIAKNLGKSAILAC